VRDGIREEEHWRHNTGDLIDALQLSGMILDLHDAFALDYYLDRSEERGSAERKRLDSHRRASSKQLVIYTGTAHHYSHSLTDEIRSGFCTSANDTV
jgi:hypothetical protein